MRVMVLGAGGVGCEAARLLSADERHAVTVADVTDDALGRAAGAGLRAVHLDASGHERLVDALRGQDAVVAAVPNALVPAVARAAAETATHYLDLCENMAQRREVEAAGAASPALVVPGCGMSPGLVSNIARDLADRLEAPCDMVIRVGALPRTPTNRLGYGLTWNLQGLIDEYTLPCDALEDGRPAALAPLERYETFTIDGCAYEAFTTSGGFGSLCELLEGRVRSLTFKTIRYPGHLELMRFLLDDLGLSRRRDMLFRLLRNGLPEVTQDVLVVFISVRGRRNGVLAEETFVTRVTDGGASPATGPGRPAVPTVMRLSAAHVCAVLDLIASGAITGAGVRRPETLSTDLLRRSSFFPRDF